MGYRGETKYHLPQWNCDVFPHTFNGTGRTAGTPFRGQFYPPVRTSDNEGPSDGYVVYPKEITSLHDPAEYDYAGFDAVVTSWQGQPWAFAVEQVLPRFNGFLNEHRMALLRRMSAAEYQAIDTVVSTEWALPQFNMTVTPWTYDATTNTRTADTPFMARLEVGEMTSNESGRNDAFLLFGKGVGSLNDPSLYDFAGYDAITFAWGGRTLGWAVLQVLPRLAGEPAEHLQAVLRRLSASELASISTPPAACAVGESRHHRPVVLLNVNLQQQRQLPDLRLLLGSLGINAADTQAIAVIDNPGNGSWTSPQVKHEAAAITVKRRRKKC